MHCFGSLIVKGIEGDELIFSSILSTVWKEVPIEEYNLTIISLVRDSKLFDYCNLDQYTPEGVAPLLAAHGVNSSIPWFASLIFEDPHRLISGACSGLTWHDSYVFHWYQDLLYYIQRAGGKGITHICNN